MITMKSVAWDHGCLAVQNLAAMIGPVTFVLPDGRQCQPLHIAPWTFDAEAAALPGVLRRLRGEWPCVPFGFDGERTLAAGWEARGETFLGADLIHDARRDVADLGASGLIRCHSLRSFRLGRPIPAEDGILFCTYSLLVPHPHDTPRSRYRLAAVRGPRI